MSQLVKLMHSGVMDSDADLQLIGQGNYVDGVNIRHRDLTGANVGGVTPVKGNSFLSPWDGTSIPIPSDLTKTIQDNAATVAIFRIYITVSIDPNATFNGTLYVQNLSSIYPVSLSGTANISLATWRNSLASALQVAITGVTNPFIIGSVTSITSTYGYFELRKNPAATPSPNLVDDDFLLFEDGNLGEIVQKSEFVDGTGAFKVIGMQSVGNDTFIWSCTPEVTSGTPARTISEIGVLVSNPTNGTTQYTTLLQCKLLGFSQSYQIQAQVEKRTNEVILYWTDDFNKPRTLTVPYPYVPNGVLISNGGSIDFAKVDQQLSYFVANPNATITITGITEGGGSLTCGNKRYSGRFLTDDLVGTDYMYPTNPVNIYSAKKSIPSKILGDIPGTQTNKSVTIKIDNIPINEFAYFELVAIEYEGETFTLKTVQRVLLGSNTSIEITHSNNGQENLPLAPSELLAITAKFTQVKTLKIHSNRMFMSNVVEQTDRDLTAWAQTIKHSIEQKTIDSVFRTSRTGTSDMTKAYPLLKYGEYLDPFNTYANTSYMINDTYRFGIQVQWKETGKWSAPYWVDDIRFDTLAYNVTDPVGTPGSWRRTANNITTTNLGDIDSKLVYIYYPKFHNVNLNYIVNGDYLYKQIKAFRIVRSKRIPEVLATGLAVAGTRDTSSATTIIPFHKDLAAGYAVFNTYPNNFCRRYRTGAPVENIQVGDLDKSEFAYFHSADLYFNNFNYAHTAGDKLKVLNVPFSYDESILQGQSVGDFESVYEDFTGFFSSSLINYTDFAITYGQTLDTGELITSFNAGASNVKNGINVPGSGTVNAFYSNMRSCIAFQLTTKLSTISAAYQPFSKEGVVYAQIFRDKKANLKYPINKKESNYESTGHMTVLTGVERGIINSISVFGGDVFNQKTHMQVRMSTSNPSPKNGFGLGYSFYSQNVCNSQMFYAVPHNLEDAGPGYIFPQYLDKQTTGFGTDYGQMRYAFLGAGSYERVYKGSIGVGLLYWLELWPEVSNQNNYDTQFSFIDNTIVESGFDAEVAYNGDKPATVIWSQTKAVNARKDNYRVFKPIDTVDLNLNEGEIINHEILNGNLYTWQPYSVRRQSVNEPTALQGASSSSVIVGSGGVMSYPGLHLSSLGATKQWAMVKGSTISGGDSMYWYNDQLRKVIRFGENGIQIISDRGVASFLNTSANWLSDKEQPITGYGVNAGWNDRFAEALFTFKAVDPTIVQYAIYDSTPALINYTVGNLVVNNDLGGISSVLSATTAPRHISGMSYVYRCKLAHVASSTRVPGTGASWTTYWDQYTPESHPSYYTLFTLVYDEIKNGFISFLSMYPNIYAVRTNTFYTTIPNAQNKLYVQNPGNYNTFYGTAYSGSITGVINIDPNMSKTYEALQVVSHTTPKRLDFTTRDHVSFLVDSEFEEREDFYYAPVKNDSTIAGVNSSDTSRLWGRYLKIKFTFEGNVFQKLIDYVVKFRSNHRLYNK